MEDSKMEAREKHWSELDDAGKIARLREVVKQQARTIDTAYALVHRLLRHQHGVDGRILVELGPDNPISGGMARKDLGDNVYF